MGFWVLVLAATSWAQERAPILDNIAKTYGIDSWDQIQAIRYTWNGEIPGLFKLSHMWEWEPKTGKVSSKERIKTASRSRSHTTALNSTVNRTR